MKPIIVSLLALVGTLAAACGGSIDEPTSSEAADVATDAGPGSCLAVFIVPGDAGYSTTLGASCATVIAPSTYAGNPTYDGWSCWAYGERLCCAPDASSKPLCDAVLL
jgi:hypothetical protein